MSYGYGYAVARLRAMERRFLDGTVLQRMVEAEDYGQALKVLAETVYGGLLTGEEMSAASLERALEGQLLELYEEVRGFLSEETLLTLVRLPYDFHNAKTLLKSAILVKQGGRKRWDLLTSLASFPVDDLISAVDSEDYRLLPFGLDRAIPEALARHEATHDLVEMERVLDFAQFAALSELAGRIGTSGILRWARFRVDGENLRACLRLRRFGFEAGRVAAFLCPGGEVGHPLLLSLLGEPLEAWPRSLAFSSLAPVLAQFGEGKGAEELLSLLETLLEEEGLRLLEADRSRLEAPENVLWHLLAKETEIRNLRILLVSKANSTDRAITRRLLRRGTPG